MKIYVFVGGGPSNGVYYVKKVSGTDKYVGGNNRELYMLYPEVSESYERLKTPSDAEW